MVEPACVAYHGAKRGEITKDDSVLIVGSGPIGLFCMQSCKALGAKKVYVSDLDESRLELAIKLGADGVINAKSETLKDGLTRLCATKRKSTYSMIVLVKRVLFSTAFLRLQDAEQGSL